MPRALKSTDLQWYTAGDNEVRGGRRRRVGNEGEKDLSMRPNTGELLTGFQRDTHRLVAFCTVKALLVDACKD